MWMNRLRMEPGPCHLSSKRCLNTSFSANKVQTMVGRPDQFPHNMCVSKDLERRFPWVVVGATSMLGGKKPIEINEN